MVSTITIIAIVNIIFGILILTFPNFLRLIVGLYFILIGLFMLIFGAIF
ncbi:DUF3096 domain-containing protein [Candidatus Woesearchaeota archaeon]|nr:DUF3096 domain-containing protein [Candidatus Woesearchaeota archaeon]